MKTYQDKQYLAISAIWYERFLECSRTYGTIEFPQSVWRFYYSLLDLDKEELAIKKKVTKYVEEIWEPSIIKKTRETNPHNNDPGIYDFDKQQIIAQHIHEIFSYIIQTIQDTGIGWHISTSDGDAWDYDDAIKKD